MFTRVFASPESEPPIPLAWVRQAATCEPSDPGVAAGATTVLTKQRTYPWGDEPPTPARCNIDGLRGGLLRTDALAGGGSSAFGCRQMLGQVWEWTGTACRGGGAPRGRYEATIRSSRRWLLWTIASAL